MKLPKRIELTRNPGWFAPWGLLLGGFPLWGGCAAAIISLCATAAVSPSGGFLASDKKFLDKTDITPLYGATCAPYYIQRLCLIPFGKKIVTDGENPPNPPRIGGLRELPPRRIKNLSPSRPPLKGGREGDKRGVGGIETFIVALINQNGISPFAAETSIPDTGDRLLLPPLTAGNRYQAVAPFSIPDRELIMPSWQNPQLLDTIEGHTALVSSLAFSPDGKILASGGGTLDPKIKLWNLEKRKPIATPIGHQTRILTMAFAPDGKTLVSGGEDRLVNLWDIESGELIHTFAAHSSHIMSLAITPDGNTLVSAALDGMVLWNLPERQFVESRLRFQPTYSAAIAPNGRILATGGKNKEIQLWNLSPNCNGRASCLAEESNPRAVLKGHEGPVSALGFAADGEILVSASHDRTIAVWNPSNGDRKIIGRHSSEVKSLAISPDSRTVASAGRDGIKLWHLRTGKLLYEIPEGVEGVRALAFSPDGNILATGGANNTIKIWHNGPIVGDKGTRETE